MYVHAAVACSQPTDGKAFQLAMQVRHSCGFGLSRVSPRLCPEYPPCGCFSTPPTARAAVTVHLCADVRLWPFVREPQGRARAGRVLHARVFPRRPPVRHVPPGHAVACTHGPAAVAQPRHPRVSDHLGGQVQCGRPPAAAPVGGGQHRRHWRPQPRGPRLRHADPAGGAWVPGVRGGRLRVAPHAPEAHAGRPTIPPSLRSRSPSTSKCLAHARRALAA